MHTHDTHSICPDSSTIDISKSALRSSGVVLKRAAASGSGKCRSKGDVESRSMQLCMKLFLTIYASVQASCNPRVSIGLDLAERA